MNATRIKLGLITFSFCFLAACASNEVEKEEYSGFLSPDHYEKVKKVELEDGDISYRWISKSFDRANYSGLIVDPITYFPAPQVSEQASQETLDKIADYMTQALKNKLSAEITITDKPGPGVARLSAAITGVKIETKSMQAYEVVPVAAVFGAVSAATGNRDMVTEVYVESRLQDTESGAYLGFAIRKIRGSNLENVKAQLTLEDVKEELDEAAADAAATISTE